MPTSRPCVQIIAARSLTRPCVQASWVQSSCSIPGYVCDMGVDEPWKWSC